MVDFSIRRFHGRGTMRIFHIFTTRNRSASVTYLHFEVVLGGSRIGFRNLNQMNPINFEADQSLEDDLQIDSLKKRSRSVNEDSDSQSQSGKKKSTKDKKDKKKEKKETKSLNLKLHNLVM